MCRSKHVEQLRNIEITNSTTRSHLVGYFYKIYIMMHGSMNIKFGKKWCIDKSNVILQSKFGVYCNFEIAILTLRVLMSYIYIYIYIYI